MLTNFKIEGYRGFKSLKVDGLSRVNLFVGQNNSGKTSLLEAAQVIAAEGSPSVLFRSLRRRGEIIPPNDLERTVDELDVSHLFYGHALSEGATFNLQGFNDRQFSIKCEIVSDPKDTAAEQLPIFDMESGVQLSLALSIGPDRVRHIPLSPFGGIRTEALRRRVLVSGRVVVMDDSAVDAPAIQVVPTEGLETSRMSLLWDAIALTPDESKVIEALQIIEPDIEKIAFLGREAPRGSGGVFVKFRSSDMRLPIGSLGDGVKRLLSLTLAAIRASGGYLVIDEIDTGLHHTIMADMWRIVITTAERLNIQVFATTHSQDCIRSLARLQNVSPQLAEEVSVHRLERGVPESIRYTANEIATADLQEIEVR